MLNGEKLKACPFCGKDVFVVNGFMSPDNKVFWYELNHGQSRECSVSMMDKDKNNLIQSWNQRTEFNQPQTPQP